MPAVILNSGERHNVSSRYSQQFVASGMRFWGGGIANGVGGEQKEVLEFIYLFLSLCKHITKAPESRRHTE